MTKVLKKMESHNIKVLTNDNLLSETGNKRMCKRAKIFFNCTIKCKHFKTIVNNKTIFYIFSSQF